MSYTPNHGRHPPILGNAPPASCLVVVALLPLVRRRRFAQHHGRLAPRAKTRGKGRCSKASINAPKKPTPVKLAPSKREAPFRVGGKPDWLQRDDHAECPQCGEPELFLAQLARFEIPRGAEGPAATLYVFVCAPCRVTTLVRQMT